VRPAEGRPEHLHFSLSMSDLNDPRVFYAAERTLLAWGRTSLGLMAFGFVIERVGILTGFLERKEGIPTHTRASFWIGIIFVLLGSVTAANAALQFRQVLKTLKPVEKPEGYKVNFGVFTDVTIAALGLVLIAYLLLGPKY
jgi:putative membrane protein